MRVNQNVQDAGDEIERSVVRERVASRPRPDRHGPDRPPTLNSRSFASYVEQIPVVTRPKPRS